MNTLLLVTDIVEKLVLISLLGLSVWSVSIMIDRRRVIRDEAQFDYAHLKSSFEKLNLSAIRIWGESKKGYLGGALLALIDAGKNPVAIDRAVSGYMKSQKMSLERGLAVLATLGSNAPFIGLFGTVLGIIRAFAELGNQSGSASVMSGVSQALYATAMGLLVAIPAVVAYNVFTRRIKELHLTVESLRDIYLSQLTKDHE